ncbi:MraY family glycosyltransferase [Magnetospirillum moscoviense]|uniref:Glycosyl transferase n=1 Tax=Magnetospirillum moscoviense TaxID=1437059 RepID=A0A178MYG3_9PROT|nr:glycosyltransferase family 4 protein [Magnetospirillum moscoviense]OAN54988.1 glycosyl transferase [Magnetospirillum moscoviense]
MPQAWPWLVVAGAATLVAGRAVLSWLKRRQILDFPNERSSHTLPTPRGGGLATSPVMAALMLLMGWQARHPLALALGAGTVVLLAVSWIDDRRGLAPGPRFLVQAAMVALGVTMLAGWVISPALPWWLDALLAGLGWLWFVNLYNFMDGIDGITGIETMSLGGGIAIVAGLAGADPVVASAALTVAVIGGTFLHFNWHPARMFLGDSGSVPFGFVLGGLLAALAAEGQLAAALILPAYYVADATITLTRRALRGEKVWQAHRLHFYQRAVQGGKRHDQVAAIIGAANIVLIGAAALAAMGLTWVGLGAAIAVVAALLAVLSRWSKGAPA